MAIKLKNPETAAKYETDFTHDQRVHIPGGTAGDGWEGNLSEIPLPAADKAFAMQSNLVKLKAPAEQPAPEAGQEERKSES